MKDTTTSTASNDSALSPKDARVSAAVFEIQNETGLGSAWLVDKNTYVTDAHCLDDGREIFLVDHAGLRHRLGGDVWIDQVHDLALITTAPGTDGPGQTPLKLRDSISLTAAEPLTFFGFHTSSHDNPRRFSGTATGHLSQIEIYNRVVAADPHPADMLADLARFNKIASHPVPGDRESETLRRNLVLVDADVDLGDSGGPAVDKAGRVVGNMEAINGKFKMLDPSEDIANLVNNRDRFEHHRGYYETGLHGMLNQAKQAPLYSSLIAGGDTIAFAGYGAAMVRQQSLAKLGVTSKIFGAIAAYLAANQLYSDASNLKQSTNSADRHKYAIATAADTVMLGGLALSVVPRLAKGALIGVAVGLMGRLGSELVPNSYVVDIGQHQYY